MEKTQPRRAMSGRDRFLCALNNEKPDRLPCQVHNWMAYYLKTYLGGVDQYGAYERFGMDPVIYTAPRYLYDERDLANWRRETVELGTNSSGHREWALRITTPGGVLTTRYAANAFTSWVTEPLIKGEVDFDIWNRYVPVPTEVDWTPVRQAKERIGDRGITRGGFFDFGQGSPWQSFCTLFGTQEAIMAAMDRPDWIHYVLSEMLAKKLAVIERAGRIELDLVETGGGAGSSTVISPRLHREFCLPYDQRQHAALRAAGARVVYHLCGGLMPLLESVAENGAHGLETMTPPSMGGDCNLAEANRRVGDRLFFIGGFDQNAGFERGTPEEVRRQVFALHAACPDGGYICSPSDHFFFGDPANLEAFAAAARECVYE
ncbi:MAG: uroporphyrinogen decarboxylase family protein [Armatimonadota bacterium]|nr:uroporphyrinogen decarboxylase family protein [Armatimonadota bacterium]